MPEYRWRQGRRAGRWHATRAEAVSAAVKAGVASRDEHDRKRIWWDVFAEIEEKRGAGAQPLGSARRPPGRS